MELSRAEIEERAVALAWRDCSRSTDLDPYYIDDRNLKQALRYIRALHAGEDWEGDDTPVLDCLNRIASKHHQDDPAAFTEYIDSLKNGRLPAPQFYTDLTEQDFIMPDVLIDGIVHKGGKILFSAPSKARKTWALIHLLLCVQAGKNWWGFSTKRSKALLIDCELFRPAAYNRARKVAEAAGIGDISGLAIQSLRGQRLSLDRIKKGTIDSCREHNVGLIGIDPYYRIAAGQDENSNNEIALFLEGIEEIAHESGAAIALTHHYAKGNAAVKNSIDRMAGAGTFARDPDALLAMTEADASDSDHPIFVIEPTIREFPPVEPFAIRWDFPLWIRDDSLGTALKEPKKPGRPADYGPEDLLEPLGNKTLKASAWQKLCREDRGLTQRTFYRLKKELVERGQVEETEDGFRAIPTNTYIYYDSKENRSK